MPHPPPTLNLLSAARRLGWLICPWMGTAPKPRLRSISASLRVESQVRVKMMEVEPASSAGGSGGVQGGPWAWAGRGLADGVQGARRACLAAAPRLSAGGAQALLLSMPAASCAGHAPVSTNAR